ncbi:MAG: M20 family metallopeptidase [Nitrososphaerales archaeon]
MISNIADKVESNLDEIINTASELIKIPSRNPPGEEKVCAEYIYSKLRGMGYETYLVKEPFLERPQVVALLRGKNTDTVLLNGHIDTVPEGDPNGWGIDPFSGAVKDGFLYGRGAVDMKSSLSIMMHASKFAETDGSVLLAFAVGEERAEPGTPTLLSWIKKFDLKIKYGLVMEPTGLQVATHQRGAVWFKIGIRGRAAHASMSTKGINAIERAPRLIQTIQEYSKEIAKRSHKFAGLPTCSVTMIKGGIKENVIPERCEIVIDRRLVPGESSSEVAKHLWSFLDNSKLDYELTKLASREPVELSRNSILAQTLLRVMHHMNIQTNTVCFAGATDNEHLVFNGIESLVWGPGDLAFAHSVDERISLGDIKNAAIALGSTLCRLLH